MPIEALSEIQREHQFPERENQTATPGNVPAQLSHERDHQIRQSQSRTQSRDAGVTSTDFDLSRNGEISQDGGSPDFSSNADQSSESNDESDPITTDLTDTNIRRPRRQKTLPRRFKDFLLGTVQISDLSDTK